MSLNINDYNNEVSQNNSINKKPFTKEMLQDLLKKTLDQRLIKLESSAKEHITNLNYTSKYFKEFTKAIQQFSKFFVESESLKEKEKQIIDQKESLENIKENNTINNKNNNKEIYNSPKIVAKKSNESGSSGGCLKNSSKIRPNQNNKKVEISSKTARNHTQGVVKTQQLKKQATTISLAKSLFPMEGKKSSKKNNIMSPDSLKKKKANNITKEKEGENDINKSAYFLNDSNLNIKIPKTDKRIKKNNKNKTINESIRNNGNYNNISEYKTEIEKNNAGKDNLKNVSSLKKNVNKNKKHIAITSSSKNVKNNTDDFSKTLNSKFITKEIDIDDKLNYSKSTIPNKKKRKVNVMGSDSINDIKDIVKLVDNVHQNITKLLESNDKLNNNNNRSLMISSLDLPTNKTFIESNYKSSKNLLTSNNDEEILDDIDKKGISLKKKSNHNISLFKDNNKLTDEKNKDNNEKLNKEETKIGKFIKNMSNEKSKNEENKRYENELIPAIIDMNKKKEDNKIENENQKFKNIDVIDIFKKDKKKILKNILKYLKDNEIIIFTSCNNYLDKERISFLDNKKEELLQILNLNKDETMETKIKRIKNEFSDKDISHPPKDFLLSEESKNKLKELNNNEKQAIFKTDLDKIDKDKNLLIIIYKILLVLLDKEEIYSILNDNIFWRRTSQYLLKQSSDGKIGDFILGNIPTFSFNSKSFNKIETIIKDNKENIINEKKNNENIIIAPLIKEALEYCGVIIEPGKTQGNIIIKNLKKNQMIINYLNNLKVRYFLAKYEEDEDD